MLRKKLIRDYFDIPVTQIKAGFSYEWLDLKMRHWDDMEKLPDGWRRVPHERHANLFPRMYPQEWIEREGLTLCDRPIGVRIRRDAANIRLVSNMEQYCRDHYRENLKKIGVVPITDHDGLIPPPGVEVISTAQKN